MMVGILLLTHGDIGQVMLSEAQLILPHDHRIAILDATRGEDCDHIRQRLRTLIDDHDTGLGVLIMADIPGATPYNQAVRVLRDPAYQQRVKLVTGLNLPMLLKVMNYRAESLQNLAELAVSGAINGIHIAADQ